MEQANSNTKELNGQSQKKLNNNFITKEPLLNTVENNIDEINSKNFGGEKNKINLPLPTFEHNIRNIAHNYIPINSLPDKISEDNLNLNIKQKRNISDEILENGLNLDEQNLKECYDNIENELNKLKNDKNKNINIEENKNKNINNPTNRFSFNTNSQFENDLFYYSDEEEKEKDKVKDNNKKIEEKKDNINKNIKLKAIISKDKIKNIINNIQKKEDSDISDIKTDGKNSEKNNDKEENLKISSSDKIDIDKKLLEKIEYGIDESGNPFSIKNKEEENSKKAVAYIILQKEKGKNYLIDTKGQLIPKMEDGYYNYKKDNIRLLIKDFDVQHPELRVFGSTKMDSILFEDEEKEEKKEKEEIKENEKEKNDTKTNQYNFNYNYKSIKLKKIGHLNKPKEKILLNRNLNVNFFKKNNFSAGNFEKFREKKFVLHKNLLDMKSGSPITIKKNIINNKNMNNNEQFTLWKTKENPKTNERENYIYTKNKNQNFYKKINPKNFINNNSSRNNLSINEYEKFENLDTIKRTNNILNKSATGLYTNRNYSYTINSRIGSNLKNINLNKSDYSNNFINKSLYHDESKKNINASQEIKNITCTSSRISLYKYRRNNKRGGSFSSNYCNRIYNLKGIINANKESINNLNNKINTNIDIKKDSHKDNNIYMNNKLYNKENKNNINNKIKKSKSSKYIISTIDKISNSIKYIKNKIEKNLIKLNTENDFNNNTNNTIIEKLKNSIPLSTISTNNNSQLNASKEILPYNNYNFYNKQLQLNYKNNINELNNSSNINQKNTDKKFQCAILCKEVNDIIANYSRNNNNINKNISKINTIYDYNTEIKSTDNQINSFLNKTKNKTNYNFTKIFTQRYNYITEPNKTNETNDINELYKNKLNHKFIPFDNNFQFKNNSLKYLNNYDNNMKEKNINHGIKINSKSNSISSLKEIKIISNYDRNKEMNKNLYNNYYNKVFNYINNEMNDYNFNDN